jgi:hypothetical protein
MFGLLDVALLIVSCRRHCTQCGAVFWCEPSPAHGELSVGKECHVCLCGLRYETGNREWVHLTAEERKRYLWSGTFIVPVVTTLLAAVAGYLVRWHEPYWMMAVLFGFLGFLTGMICSSFLWLKRGLRIWASLRRTRDIEPSHLAIPNLTYKE